VCWVFRFDCANCHTLIANADTCGHTIEPFVLGGSMRSMARFAVLLVVFAAVAQAQMSEKITVNYVEIPVTVVDRDGVPIRGLKAENFQVMSEGKPRSVQSLDVVDFGSDQ